MGITEKTDIYFCRDIDNQRKDFQKKYLVPFLTHFMRSREYNGDDKKFLNIYDDIVNNDKLVIPYFSYALTSDCSLKCKYCSLLIPYLKTKYKAVYTR